MTTKNKYISLAMITISNAGQRNAEICNDLSLRRKRYGIRKFIDRQRQTRNTQNCVRAVNVRGNNER